MLLPGTRRYYLLTVDRMKSAALKQLCSLSVNRITILTKVDGAQIFLRLQDRKVMSCHLLVQGHAGK